MKLCNWNVQSFIIRYYLIRSNAGTVISANTYLIKRTDDLVFVILMHFFEIICKFSARKLLVIVQNMHFYTRDIHNKYEYYIYGHFISWCYHDDMAIHRSSFHFSSQKRTHFIMKYVGVLNNLNCNLAFYYIQRLRDNISILARICWKFDFKRPSEITFHCFHDYFYINIHITSYQ